MNLASNCRYPNEYDRVDLCRPWNESQRPVLPRCLRLLSQPVIKHVAGDRFVFQRDNAPSHCAKDTIKLLHEEMLDFISPDLWPPNTQDLSPVDYKVWGVKRQRVYECRMNSVDELKQRLLKSGTVCSRTLLTRPSTSGESD